MAVLTGTAGWTAGAQPAAVSIPVVAYDGKLLPFEQFQADRHPGCPAGGGEPAAHLHTRSGRPAVALDLTEVADPAPTGCGFGLLQQGTPGSALVQLANVTPAVLAEWSARTGITVSGGDAVPPDGAQPPAPTPPAARPAPVTPFPTDRVALVLALMLAAGVIAGYLVNLRAARPSAEDSALAQDHEPADGGVLRQRLARGHSGLLALPADLPLPLDIRQQPRVGPAEETAPAETASAEAETTEATDTPRQP